MTFKCIEPVLGNAQADSGQKLEKIKKADPADGPAL